MKAQNNDAKIEILPVDLLKSDVSNQFSAISRDLGLGIGWHYLLDLSWTASQLAPLSQVSIALDAGAGEGIIQWWLAGKGVDVISVDRVSRYYLSFPFRRFYRLRGWRRKDLAPAVSVYDFLPSKFPRKWRFYPQKLIQTAKKIRWSFDFGKSRGTVYIYNQDLTNLADIPNNSVDAVVSISALEHNAPDGLRRVVRELMRVLKPGGKLIATLGASKSQDWFHEPSKGWCYTEASLRDIFDLPAGCSSNYNRYDELFESVRNCSELRDNLSDFYFKSGDNGMPWGVWNPQYIPVGVVKIKPQE